MSDAKSIWEENARTDLLQATGAMAPIELRARNPLGAALLLLFRRRIYSYAVEDGPKTAWLTKALAGTGEHLLDVGVRTGRGAGFFLAHRKRVYGIDIAQAYVDHCLEAGLIEGGSVCNIEAEDVPTPAALRPGAPDAYDVVFLGEVIEHLLDGRSALKRLAKAIRPGGHLILTTPNLAFLGNRIKLLFGRDLDGLTIDRGEVGNQHIRVFTLRLLTRLCAEAGLAVDMVGSDGTPVSVSRFVSTVPEVEGMPPLMVLPGTAWPFPTLGRTIYVRARRE
jgi:2-polyprenyl-3-methyl-5-hydroxy-6-metoxy-1,4-benzoquinol methylase